MTENDPVPGNEIPQRSFAPPNILRRYDDLAPNAAATPPVPSSRESDRLGGAKAPLLSYASAAPYPRKQAPTDGPGSYAKAAKGDAMDRRPRIGVTLGDPAGIGPEVVAKALADEDLRAEAAPLVIGSPAALDRAFRLIGSPLRARSADGPRDDAEEPGRVNVFSPHNDEGLDALPYGETSPVAGAAAVEWAASAARLATAGDVDAIATAPISKEAARLAGHADFGHQEIYQRIAEVPRVLTMLVAAPLNVVHLTTHVPLRAAAEFATRERVLEALRLTRGFFAAHGVPNPRIGVAALNPHGGEAGLIGTEEITDIRPAVEEANAEGVARRRPHPRRLAFRASGERGLRRDSRDAPRPGARSRESSRLGLQHHAQHWAAVPADVGRSRHRVRHRRQRRRGRNGNDGGDSLRRPRRRDGAAALARPTRRRPQLMPVALARRLDSPPTRAWRQSY